MFSVRFRLETRPIAGHLAGVDIPGGNPREVENWGDLGGGGSGSYQHLVTGGSGSGEDRPFSGYEAERNIPQSPGYGSEGHQLHDASLGSPMGYQDAQAQSRVWGSEWESKQPEEQSMLNKEARYIDLVRIKRSKNRMWWVVIVWALTFYIPNFFLSSMGRMKRPDVQMAWREKVALCLIIFLMCGIVLISADTLSLAGQDLTNYFPVPLKLACSNVQSDTVNLQFENWTATVPNVVHTSGASQVVKSSALANDKWGTERFLPFMSHYYKGPIVYGHKLIAGLANNRSIGIYDGGVYGLSDYFRQQNLSVSRY
ncbi:hypothetical protein PCANC_10796 [Puccinia coronata f. sp. avenae]|uniref:Uncharacterized protein n=1 Tax=Puccinia coronata f. sp. avenae TaxID=200324 RepID=A0A2N5SNT7_9BASI|nr:hypothetical protein PCANC_16922 [Puccinia coronata f. sp. avenae]PLW44842.1 hypothetical protein PCANC_10796 [Puccinia coronata f. sp. avenae]